MSARTVARMSMGFLGATLLVGALSQCGGAGNGGSSVEGVHDIRGSIASQAGNQAEMATWVIAFFEVATGATKVATIDGGGFFELKGIKTNRAYGAFLLSPSFTLQSIFGQPSASLDGSVNVFFSSQGRDFPRLIHRGPVFQAQEITNMTIAAGVAVDGNKNQIPDGAEALAGTTLTLSRKQDGGIQAGLGLSSDQDADGVDNLEDVDIDGDGLPNIVDADDDGDLANDMFDEDSNGDSTPDLAQASNDQYFSGSLVHWIAVRYQLTTLSDGAIQRSLTFLSKVALSTALPQSISILGAKTLLEGSNISTRNTDHTTTVEVWSDERTLADDGQNEDSGAQDRLYARKVILEVGKAPAVNQVIFFQLNYDDPQANLSYPYLFPSITLNAIAGSYTADTRLVTMTGSPFGTQQDFTWSVSLFQTTAGVTVKTYSSAAISGELTTFTLPAGTTIEGETYEYRITAQVRDRVPGYAAYVVESALLSLAE